MKKFKAEAEHKKTQWLKLEKWAKCVIDGEQQELTHRIGQKAIRTPILGEQSEVSNCFAFIFEEHNCVCGMFYTCNWLSNCFYRRCCLSELFVVWCLF